MLPCWRLRLIVLAVACWRLHPTVRCGDGGIMHRWIHVHDGDGTDFIYFLVALIPVLIPSCVLCPLQVRWSSLGGGLGPLFELGEL